MQIPMKSVHSAMRGKQILTDAGIRVTVGKGSGPDGCFYYLNILDRDYYPAMAILNKNSLLN